MPAIRKTAKQHFSMYMWITIGAFLAAFSIEVFLLPNSLIDGGIVGIALIFSKLFGEAYLPYLLIILNLPFVYLAFRHIRQQFRDLHVSCGSFVRGVFDGNFPLSSFSWRSD